MPSAKEQLSALFKRIADAIRAKDGTTEDVDKIVPDDYPDRIAAIESGGIDTSDADAVPSDIVLGKTAYVDGEKITGALAPAESGDTLGSGSGSTTGTPQITSSGSNITISTTVSKDILYRSGSQVAIAVPASDFGNATTSDVLSSKTFTSSAGVKQTGTITTRSSSNLSVSGATVTVPAGYYSSQVSKSVSTVTQATPTISRSGTIVTASVTQSAGYVSSGTKTASLTLPSAGSITGTLGMTGGANWSTADPNRGSGTVTITGVSQTAGFTDGFSNGTITVTVPANRLLKGRTITPTTSEQSVGAAEDILYTAIKVAGDSNLIASNIRSGVSIFGVTGSYGGGSSGAAAIDVTVVNNSAYRVGIDYFSSTLSKMVTTTYPSGGTNIIPMYKYALFAIYPYDIISSSGTSYISASGTYYTTVFRLKGNDTRQGFYFGYVSTSSTIYLTLG